ncbi:DUF6668 family protein [Calidifontibacter terrae]
MFGRGGRPSAAGTNPFLAPKATGASTQVLDRDAGDVDEALVMTTGPAEPTGAPAPQDPPLRVPTQLVDPPFGAVLQLVGLHGGAGVTTLAGVLGDSALDTGVGLDLAAAGVPVVLVARTHAHGLDLAARAARQWASGGLVGLPLLGAVLVDDGPRVGEAMSRTALSVSRAFPRTWRIEWVEGWRSQLAPTDGPARVRRARKSLLGQAQRAARVGSTPISSHTQREADQS